MLYSRSRSYLVAVSLLLVVRAFAGPGESGLNALGAAEPAAS
jgi:hypothetical protein